MIKCDLCDKESVYSDTEVNYCEIHLKDYDDHKKLIQFLKDSEAVAFYNGKIDDVIEEMKSSIQSLKDSKKDKKTHTTTFIMKDGVFMRLDGDEKLNKILTNSLFGYAGRSIIPSDINESVINK